MNYKSLIEQAIRASVYAGKEILKVYEGEIIVEMKDDKSPLTEADKRSNAAIVQFLENTAPYRDWETDRKSTRLNSSHLKLSRMPSSA